MKSLLLTVLALGVNFTSVDLRAEMPVASDPDLPQPFDSSALQAMMQKSPFNRVVDFAETYLLTGIARVDGKAMATLMHRETKKRFVVSDEPNAQGWRLAGVSGDS